ncbi:MAG: TniQ family protein [Chryseobacterium jejuense]|uniref:TniQ family protein n=1 Tax=Chryseobacterium jejuense TaxID=445960 RepID=UPI003D0EF344
MENMHILPGYIPPEEDEILSSWIFRLARSHKIKPFSFTKFCLEDPNLWNRDFDKFYNANLMTLLTKVTPLSIEQVNNLHLISYKTIIFNSELYSAFTEGILNVGIVHRNRKNKGLLACPLCLTKKQYFKKSWRLVSSIVCTDCNCHLIDECPNCHSPIVFQRLDIGKKDIYNEEPMYLCWRCNFDLRTEHTSIIENSLEIKYQKYINDSISNGYNEHTQYSFEYFNVLLSILRKARSNSNKFCRVREAFKKEFGINSIEYSKHNFELSLSLRKELLPLIYLLLSDLDGKFLPFCERNFIRNYDINRDGEPLPFWIFKLFR